MEERKRVALVLSGGGALGFAHIGVIKVLQEYNIPIDIVVGTSMGSLVGASYCAGLSVEEMIDFACKFKTINLVDINFDVSGLFSGKGVMKEVHKFLPEVNIESMDKAFACVATDLYNDKEIVFRTGPIRDAVRASISIPGIFVPIQTEDNLLVDGGLLNNMPEDVAMEMGADIIISVDVLNKFRLNKKPKNMFETLIYSLAVATKEIQSLKSNHADVVLRPDMKDLSQLTFAKDKTLLAIERGEIEARAHIEEIVKLINEK
jgi:NTE family protein